MSEGNGTGKTESGISETGSGAGNNGTAGSGAGTGTENSGTNKNGSNEEESSSGVIGGLIDDVEQGVDDLTGDASRASDESK